MIDSYFSTAKKNIEFRFDVELLNIYEMDNDTESIGALGYLINGNIFLISPVRSAFCSKNIPTGKRIGNLIEIKGNINDPKLCRAEILDVPAIVISNDKVFFYASPFTNFQKWLQFEIPITVYLNWYDRMFWLDEFASNLIKIIELYSPKNLRKFYKDKNIINYIVLRHDVDNSRDLSYLKFEQEHNIPATYALLLDKNLKFWLKKLKYNSLFEIAFHFASNHIGMIDNVKTLLNKIVGTKFRIENKPVNWKKNPLHIHKQISKFIKESGIEISTLHRHFSFVRLPDFINQLEMSKNKFPFLLGSSSFFRATVLLNNFMCANGISYGYYHYEPDVGSPFWYPFKLYNPISKKIVNLWEQSHIMEPNENILDYIFRKRIYGINKNLFIIGLHPAHANTKTFHPKGQIEVLRYLYSLKEKYNLKFMTYKSFLKGIEDET